jgi:hypothetical protein
MKLVENPKLPLPEEPLLPEKPRSGVLLIVDYLRSLVGYDDGGPTTDSTLKSTTSPAP